MSKRNTDHGKLLAQRLAEPFESDEIHFKPQAIRGNRALALAYVDARCVMERLDEVFGVGGWQDDYELLPGGSVVCRLQVRVGDEWIVKTDVGGQSEQPDDSDKLKAAFSDALKRAAVKLQIGRYLYRLPKQWAEFDPQRREFVSPPRLPDWACRPSSASPRTEENDKSPDDPSETISQSQAEELARLLTQRKIPWSAFSRKFGVKRLTQLPLQDFEEAKEFAASGDPALVLGDCA
jgi:hypothetical protein